MGEVYEGTAPELDRRVAIKRVLKTESSDEMSDLFLREVAVCSTLEHPNVVEVIDAGPADGDLYLVMEFVDGPSLAELLDALRLQNERLPVEVTCGIVAQVARGLAHAHERALPDGTSLGIVHRDVAAENVLITRGGLPKLVDFGLATLSGHQFTNPGTIRGRPRALSPEQARGEKIDARSDIFSLGAMMFELASGRPLYASASIATMLWKVVAGDYDPIEPRLGGADPDLVQIIQTALAVEPQRRFRSARELERALDGFRAQRGMRIESGRIAALINRVWDDIVALRKDRREEGPGELEGRWLVLPADELAVSLELERTEARRAAESKERDAAGGPSNSSGLPGSGGTPPPNVGTPPRMARPRRPSQPQPAPRLESTTFMAPEDLQQPVIAEARGAGPGAPRSKEAAAWAVEPGKSPSVAGDTARAVAGAEVASRAAPAQATAGGGGGQVERAEPAQGPERAEGPGPARRPERGTAGGALATSKARSWLWVLGVLLVIAAVALARAWHEGPR